MSLSVVKIYEIKPFSAVQELLENCSSVKVKRMFLYLADKFKHLWLDLIDLSNVDLGSITHLLKTVFT